MKDYSKPQIIWNNWVETHEPLVEELKKVQSEGDGAAAYHLTSKIEMFWELTKNELMLAVMVKYLGIDTSNQTKTEVKN